MPGARRAAARTNRDVATANTASEHDDVLTAVIGLERALASPTYERRAAWRRRVRRDLVELGKAVRAHRASAEGRGGLCETLELQLGRTRHVRRIEHDHEHIEQSIGDLQWLLREGMKSGGTEEAIRRKAESLTVTIRRHHALEAEVLLEAFERDIGVGD